MHSYTQIYKSIVKISKRHLAAIESDTHRLKGACMQKTLNLLRSRSWQNQAPTQRYEISGMQMHSI